MKNWSIKTKIIILSACQLSLMLIVAVVEGMGVKEVSEHLNRVEHVDLPAVRNMTLIDMMHDGLRAVVFHALLESESGSVETKKEIAVELKEFSDNIKKYKDEINKLDIDEVTKKSIEASSEPVHKYVEASEEIVGLALSGRRDLASAKLDKFNAAFSELEESLGQLGELIEKNAEESSKIGDAAAAKNRTMANMMIIFSLIIGTLLSFFIIRDLLKTLASLIAKLSHSSQEVSAASTQSAGTATELSEASTEQAASLQETMASVEEISAMVNQNAESAVKVKNVVDMNQKSSDEGSTSVNEMLAAIGEIKNTNDEILNQMEVSNKEFAEIVKIISEIGEKTKVINDIVFQTKLLSFNASVEAARAGEHGKGFAVVAEEVGNLAQMSGNAAKQITEMLAGSIKKVNEIVEQTTHRVDKLVEIGKDKISMGQSTAQKCREALTRIADSAKTVATMVNEIAHASKEQAQGVQEINKAIGQLDQVTQQNSAVAQHSSSQAEQLSGQSKALAEAVATLVQFSGVATEGQAPLSSSSAHQQRATTAHAHNVRVLPSKKVASHAAPAAAKNVSGSDVTPSAESHHFEDL